MLVGQQIINRDAIRCRIGGGDGIFCGFGVHPQWGAPYGTAKNVVSAISADDRSFHSGASSVPARNVTEFRLTGC